MAKGQPGTAGIIAVVDDMFFAAKIRAAVEVAGGQIEFVKSLDQFINRKTAIPFLVIVDLNSTRVNPFELIRAQKSDPELKTIPTIGFVSHVQAELKRQASDAGCDLVMPRSAFT